MLRKAEPLTEFPLRFHKASGQWVKKIRQRVYYFGKDQRAALEKYEAERADLEAGIPTVAELTKAFLKDRAGLAPRTLRDYRAVCEAIDGVAGPKRLSKLTAKDFQAIKAALSDCGAVRARNQLTWGRSIFKWGQEAELITTPINYAFHLKGPKTRELREATKATKGERLFEAKEILALIETASQPLKAMIWLASAPCS